MKIISFLLLAICFTSYSQDTIDTVKRVRNFNISTSGNYSSGNVYRLLFGAKTRYKIENKKTDYDAAFAFTYGNQDNSLREEEFDFITSIKMFKHKRIYAIGFAELHRSYKRSINYQHGIGVGFGNYLINKEFSKMSVSFALLNQTTDFSKIDDDLFLHRFSVRIKGKHYINKTYFKYLIWYQPAIELKTLSTSLYMEYNIPLFKSLFLNVSYLIEYDNLVVEDVKPLDNVLLFGMKMDFNTLKSKPKQ